MAALTGVQVGLAMVATRALEGQVGPFTLGFLRYVIGCLVLLPFFLRLRTPRIAVRDRWPVLALGVVQFGVLIALLNAGLERLPAATSAVLFATFPLITILLGAVLGTERLSLGRLGGAALSVAGVAICLGGTTMPGDPLGAVLVLGAALSGALCATFYRPYLQRYPTLQIGMVAMLAAVVTLLPLSLVEASPDALAALPAGSWWLILLIGLSSGAGYVLWLTALKHAAASEATILMGLSPVTALLLGWLWLSEPLTAGFTMGLALVLSGVALAVLSRG